MSRDDYPDTEPTQFKQDHQYSKSIPRKGMYFEHMHWLDSRLPVSEAVNSRHLVFQVTKIAGGMVYYRAVYRHSNRLELGHAMKCTIEQFPEYAKAEVDAASV